MVTVAPPNLYRAYALLGPHLVSLRRSGVVGDLAHVKGGGYHISRDDLLAHGQGDDYSIQAPADRRGRGDLASAIDLGLDQAEMVAVSKRLKAAFDADDDRIDCLREFIGTVNGRDVCGWNRYQTNRTSRRTGWYPTGYADTSHLWHVHLSFFRDYANDPARITGVVDVIAGRETPAPPDPTKPNPNEESIVATEQIDKLVQKLFRTDGLIPSPDRDDTNPYWYPSSYIRGTYLLLRDIRDVLREIRDKK